LVHPATPPVINAFHVLRNDLPVNLRQNDSFFRDDQRTAACKTVLDLLMSVLWVVDGQGQSFQTTANVPALPAALIFDAHRVLGHKKLPELTQRALSAAHNKLAAVLLESRVRSAAWGTVRRDLEAMHASMVAY
jgi:hypothetical protein